MVEGTAKLICDLGNSGTRVTTKFGKNSKGIPMSRLVTISNVFGNITQQQAKVSMGNTMYTEENSRIFNNNEELYCNGRVCSTEFEATVVRPTALEKKYSSLATRLALHNAFCKGYEAIADFTKADYDSIDVNWDVTLLLPPEDIESGAKQLAEMVRSITEVDFMMPKLKKEIKINGVKIFPEGFAAFIAVLYEDSKKLRPAYTYLTEEGTKTLICDIGAGTTDFSLADGSHIISSTRFTREVGGNNVHQRMRKLMRDKGINLTDSAARVACETGVAKSGAKKYPCINEIQQAKREVARQLVDAVQEFFENTMISTQSISNILIVGGGAEISDVAGIEPISDYVMDFMKRLSKDIALVELPKVTNEEGVESRMSPRLCNVIGASILADL